jgi:hypothetical protein
VLYVSVDTLYSLLGSGVYIVAYLRHASVGVHTTKRCMTTPTTAAVSHGVALAFTSDHAVCACQFTHTQQQCISVGAVYTTTNE